MLIKNGDINGVVNFQYRFKFLQCSQKHLNAGFHPKNFQNFALMFPATAQKFSVYIVFMLGVPTPFLKTPWFHLDLKHSLSENEMVAICLNNFFLSYKTVNNCLSTESQHLNFIFPMNVKFQHFLFLVTVTFSILSNTMQTKQ